jgi:hypothetical protein
LKENDVIQNKKRNMANEAMTVFMHVAAIMESSSELLKATSAKVWPTWQSEVEIEQLIGALSVASAQLQELVIVTKMWANPE